MREKILKYIETWEQRCYFDGIPDEAPKELESLGKVPSYRRICLAILKNDYPLKTLGFTPNESKYYGCYKRIELAQRSKTKQLKLDL